ncbi:hypothetical protein N431DRAFT_483238 [Stipitochalara longipes BDJ]|nr:hypothetical protein N431DRAFT_483238 [Stipitochalara longipes BDJ]
MTLRARNKDWNWGLEKRDDSDCDDESDGCTSSTTSQTIASTSFTTSQATLSQPTLQSIGPGEMPLPPPSGGPAPPSGGPKGPKPPKQTSTTSTGSTAAINSTTSTTPPIASTSSLTRTSPQTSLANGVGTLPTTIPTPPQKQPAPSLTSADLGISSINDSSATAIKAASAIIAVEATVIITVLLLIFYKLYTQKRQKIALNGAKGAIDHTSQARSPFNDGNGGAGFATPVLPSAVLRDNNGVWMGPGIVHATVFSSQNERQAQSQPPNMEQLREGQPLGSNPSNFPAASHAENPFFAMNEKALPEIHLHEAQEQMHDGVPEIPRQSIPFIAFQEADRPKIVDVSDKRGGASSRGEKELLEMERELADLERKRGRQGGWDRVSGSV